MSYDKGRFLIFIDKNRTTIALLVALPLIGLLFWFMYATALEHSGKREVTKEQSEGKVVMVRPSESDAPRTVKPDITTILGLKKSEPKKLEQAPVVIMTRESSPQAGGPQQQSSDPYPDAK
jgi:hypothetical protein